MGSFISKEIPVAAVRDPKPETALEDLPFKILKKVLMNVSSSRRTLLELRLVNQEWNGAINSILEEKVLSCAWSPFPIMNLLSHSLNAKSIFHCPSAIDLELEKKVNPFPANCLVPAGTTPSPKKKSTSTPKKRDAAEDPNQLEAPPSPQPYPPELKLDDFQSKFGGFLTSLTIQNLSLTLETLAGLLNSMNNLKTLTICNIKVTDFLNKMILQTLPSLPHLDHLTTLHLHFFDKFDEKLVNDKRKIRIFQAWLIAFYAGQLEKLEMDGEVQLPQMKQGIWNAKSKFVLDSKVIAFLKQGAFDKLKELKIYRPCRKFLELRFPMLERLSIKCLAGGKEVDFMDVTGFVESCADTLLYLHLDIKWEELLERNYHPRGEDGKELGVGVKLESVRKDAIISKGELYVFREKMAEKLKTLAFHVPKDEVEASMIKNSLVAKFPGLERLKFLHFEKVAGHNALAREESGADMQVKNFIDKENFWELCKELKSVAVCSGEGPSGDIYVEYRKGDEG